MKIIKKLSFLLLLGALVVGPVRVSAMMEEGKKSEKPTHEELVED